jgi:hypothetical protein
MPWFKVDDQLAFHPKVLACPPTSLALWLRAGAWCAGQLTDGRLPAAMLSPFGCRRRDAEKLVEVGLWEHTEDGYRFRNWEEYQPTKAQVEAERAKNKERQSRWRKRVSDGDSNAVTDDVTDAVSADAPTRPDPTTSKEETSSLPPQAPPAKRSTPKGTRLPADWKPSPEDVTAAAEYGIAGAALTHEADSFRDYWTAKAGKDAVKIDWAATWRNWVRRNRAKVNGNGTVHPLRPGQSQQDRRLQPWNL